jgi:hypothetical protein
VQTLWTNAKIAVGSRAISSLLGEDVAKYVASQSTRVRSRARASSSALVLVQNIGNTIGSIHR